MLPSRLFFDDSFFKGDESIKSDIYEKDGRLVVEMEAPGYTKDDIDISIDKGTLSMTKIGVKGGSLDNLLDDNESTYAHFAESPYKAGEIKPVTEW